MEGTLSKVTALLDLNQVGVVHLALSLNNPDTATCSLEHILVPHLLILSRVMVGIPPKHLQDGTKILLHQVNKQHKAVDTTTTISNLRSHLLLLITLVIIMVSQQLLLMGNNKRLTGNLDTLNQLVVSKDINRRIIIVVVIMLQPLNQGMVNNQRMISKVMVQHLLMELQLKMQLHLHMEQPRGTLLQLSKPHQWQDQAMLVNSLAALLQ